MSAYSDDYSSDQSQEESKASWRKSVLDSHYESTQMIERTLKDVKVSRARMERSLNETRNVINVWTDYNDKLSNAISDLGMRIDRSYQSDRKKELKKQSRIIQLENIRRPTKLALTRARAKFSEISKSSTRV